MKKLALSFLFISVVVIAKAQETTSSPDKFFLAGGIVLGLPVGELGDTHSFGIGLELQPEYKINQLFALYGSTGYVHFFGKNLDFIEFEDVGVIPFVAGPKLYLNPHFFVGVKLGAALLTGAADGVGFAYLPQLGFNTGKYLINFNFSGISKGNVSVSNLALSLLYKL